MHIPIGRTTLTRLLLKYFESKSNLNLISTLLHELGHFLSRFKANHNDEWYTTTCYLAAILHETHKQHLGRIFPNVDPLSVAKSAVTY